MKPLGAVLAMLLVSPVLADEYTTIEKWMMTFIPSSCCITNHCCWEISERELQSLPDDEWLIKSTGQVRKRTAWSPDGKFYRCACDSSKDEDGNSSWVRHQGANTRCIFVPMRVGGVTGGQHATSYQSIR